MEAQHPVVPIESLPRVFQDALESRPDIWTVPLIQAIQALKSEDARVAYLETRGISLKDFDVNKKAYLTSDAGMVLLIENLIPLWNFFNILAENIGILVAYGGNCLRALREELITLKDFQQLSCFQLVCLMGNRRCGFELLRKKLITVQQAKEMAESHLGLLTEDNGFFAAALEKGSVTLDQIKEISVEKLNLISKNGGLAAVCPNAITVDDIINQSEEELAAKISSYKTWSFIKTVLKIGMVIGITVATAYLGFVIGGLISLIGNGIAGGCALGATGFAASTLFLFFSSGNNKASQNNISAAKPAP